MKDKEILELFQQWLRFSMSEVAQHPMKDEMLCYKKQVFHLDGRALATKPKETIIKFLKEYAVNIIIQQQFIDSFAEEVGINIDKIILEANEYVTEEVNRTLEVIREAKEKSSEDSK